MHRILLVLVFFMVSSISFAQETHEHRHHLMGGEQHGIEEEAQDFGICPVMGGKASKEYFYTYEGKTYYFCCPVCVGEFKKDPQKYIKKVEEELQSESKEESKHEEHEMQVMQEPETSHEGMHQGHHHSH